jgi:hypothetical protein
MTTHAGGDHLVALGACRELLQATRASLAEMLGLAEQLQADLRRSLARVHQAELAVMDAIATAEAPRA